MKERDLGYFMGLKYTVLMKKVDDGYCAFIPELSLLVEGKSASDAFELLEQKKTEYFKRVLAVNAGDTVREPLAVTIRKRFKEDIVLFGAKTLVVGVIFGIIVSILLPSIDVFVSTRINPMKFMGVMIRQVDSKFGLMSDKEKEEIHLRIRGIAKQMKPFVDDLKIIFNETRDSDIKSTPQKKKKSL